MTTLAQTSTGKDGNYGTWADLSSRWFFAWWMAVACQEALQEIHVAMGRRPTTARRLTLERTSQLFRRELVHWVERGEALDMIVGRVPTPPN